MGNGKRKWSFLVLLLTLVLGLSVQANAAVKISKKKATLYAGQTLTLKVTGTKKKVKWSSSKKSVAKVTTKGKVTAVKKGSATITAKVGSKKYTCKITVKKPYINKKKLTLMAGKSAKLKLTGTKIKSVKTSSSKVATIAKTGTVKAVGAGTATITITGKDKKKYTCEVTVKAAPAPAPVKVTGVTLNKTTLSLTEGETASLTAAVTPANAANKNITWTSGNAAVAKVVNGSVTAVGAGTTAITATAADGSGKSASCTVTVAKKTVAVTGVTLNKTALKLYPGDKSTLTAAIAPANATNKTVTWSSSNAAIATVSGGQVSAVAVGSATITATAADGSGKKASCTVTVEAKPVAVSAVALDQTQMTLYPGESGQLTATVSPSNASNKNVNWSSSNPAVVTVNGGMVAAAAPGTATVTATAADGSGKSAQCTVTVRSTSVTVSTQEELEQALNTPAIREILLSTTASVRIVIPEMTRDDVDLIIDMPAGEVENHARLHTITIRSIAADTYVECAVGNTIIYEAASGHIKIETGAKASIIVEDCTASVTQTLTIEDNSGANQVSEVTIHTQVELTVVGSTRNLIVNAEDGAAGSTVESNNNLTVRADAKINLVLNPGAEQTTVTVTTQINIPDITGLGRISVTNTVTGIETFVVADNNGGSLGNVQVTGRVFAGEETPAAVQAFLFPYDNQMDEAAAVAKTGEAIRMSATDPDGLYGFENVPYGSYKILLQAQGYKPVLLDAIITSFTAQDGSFRMQDITLVAEVENEQNGRIAGRITDAQTGAVIDFPVNLILRSGADNITGTILVQGSFPDGAFAFEDLKPGIYTIQAVSAGGEEQTISSSWITVSLASGADSSGHQITVTRTLLAEQVQFILHWRGESDSVPADLDSHLVGPAMSGGRFHVYYIDKTWYEEAGLAADLDVDDTTWEGPETTTIYESVPGIYSFYIYDYTDQEDEYSTRMSSNSGAYVELLSNNVRVSTVSIPTGKAGNLWHVADYNSITGRFTIINTVGYWPNEGSATVGQSEQEVLLGRLNSAIENLSSAMEGLYENAFYQSASQALEAARSVYANSASTEEITGAIASLTEYSKKIQDAFYLYGSDITGDNLTEARISGNRIYTYGRAEQMGAITITPSNYNEEALSVTFLEESGVDYVAAAIIENTVSGVARKYYIAYEQDDRDMFRILSLSGEGIINYSVDQKLESGSIHIYGTVPQLPQLSLELEEGVTASEVLYDEEEEVSYIILTSGAKTYRYDIRYTYDLRSHFGILEVTGDGIADYDVDQYPAYGDINIRGTHAQMPALTIKAQEGVSVSDVLTDEDEGMHYVMLSKGDMTYRYDLYYTHDLSSRFVLKSVTATGVVNSDDNRYAKYGEIYLYGYLDHLEGLTPVFEDPAVTWQVYDQGSTQLASYAEEYGDMDAAIAAKNGDDEYVFCVWYEQDAVPEELLTIENVSGTGVVHYESTWHDDEEDNEYQVLRVYTDDIYIPADLTVQAPAGVDVLVDLTPVMAGGREFDGTVTLSLSAGAFAEPVTKVFYLAFEPDNWDPVVNAAKITDVSGTGIWHMEDSYGTVTVYGVTEAFPDDAVITAGAWECELIREEEDGLKVRIRVGDYYVEKWLAYDQDYEIFKEALLTDETITLVEMWPGDAYDDRGSVSLKGISPVLPSALSFNEEAGFAGSVLTDPENADQQVLSVVFGGVERLFEISYELDKAYYALEAVDGAGITEYQWDLYSAWYNEQHYEGYLEIRGFAPELPADVSVIPVSSAVSAEIVEVGEEYEENQTYGYTNTGRLLRLTAGENELFLPITYAQEGEFFYLEEDDVEFRGKISSEYGYPEGDEFNWTGSLYLKGILPTLEDFTVVDRKMNVSYDYSVENLPDNGCAAQLAISGDGHTFMYDIFYEAVGVELPYGEQRAVPSEEEEVWYFIPPESGLYTFSLSGNGSMNLDVRRNNGAAEDWGGESVEGNAKYTVWLDADVLYAVRTYSYEETPVEILAEKTTLDPIDAGMTRDIEITQGGDVVYLEFTPDTGAVYVLEAFDNLTGDEEGGEYLDNYASLYQAGSTQELTSDDDSAGNGNFRLYYEVEAGQTYYFAVRMYSSEVTGAFQVRLYEEGSEEQSEESGAAVENHASEEPDPEDAIVEADALDELTESAEEEASAQEVFAEDQLLPEDGFSMDEQDVFAAAEDVLVPEEELFEETLFEEDVLELEDLLLSEESVVEDPGFAVVEADAFDEEWIVDEEESVFELEEDPDFLE